MNKWIAEIETIDMNWNGTGRKCVTRSQELICAETYWDAKAVANALIDDAQRFPYGKLISLREDSRVPIEAFGYRMPHEEG